MTDNKHMESRLQLLCRPLQRSSLGSPESGCSSSATEYCSTRRQLSRPEGCKVCPQEP